MFFLLYLRWHYTAGLRAAAFNALAYPMAFLEYFSVPHLFRTLFSTWHHDLMSYGRGFDPADFVWILVGNILSRVIGAIVRVITITIGVFVSMCTFLIRVFWLALWITLPLLIPFFFLRGLALIFF